MNVHEPAYNQYYEILELFVIQIVHTTPITTCI